MQQAIKPLLAGNWKMNGTASSWEALARDIASESAFEADVDMMIAPPFLGVGIARDEILAAGSALTLGVQNVHAELAGAYTGEISFSMLADFGVKYAILGHSERREMMGETDASVALKAKTARDASVVPIVCIGEPLYAQECGKTEAFILEQLAGSLRGVYIRNASELVVAYEPVWAIGSGKAATPEIIAPVMQAIRRFLMEKYGAVGEHIRILYGGSVKPENTAELMAVPHLNGFLVGGAALKAESFLGIASKMR